MPRPKSNNQCANKMIKPNKLTKDVIQDYDCVGGILYFKELSPIEKNILSTYYKFKLTEEENGFTFSVKNSWKSVLQLLTAIYYLRKAHRKYGEGKGYFLGHVSIGLSNHIRMATDYLNDIAIQEEEELWERMSVPTGYKSFYVKSKYEENNIICGINILIKELAIDIAKSSLKFVTRNLNRVELPPVHKKDKRDVVGDHLIAFNSIVYVKSSMMKQFLDEYLRVFVALPLRSPQSLKKYLEEVQDVTFPYKFIAYPILEENYLSLIKYYPRQKETIESIVKKTNVRKPYFSVDDDFLHTGCSYLITDINSLGQWD